MKMNRLVLVCSEQSDRHVHQTEQQRTRPHRTSVASGGRIWSRRGGDLARFLPDLTPVGGPGYLLTRSWMALSAGLPPEFSTSRVSSWTRRAAVSATALVT